MVIHLWVVTPTVMTCHACIVSHLIYHCCVCVLSVPQFCDMSVCVFVFCVVTLFIVVNSIDVSLSHWVWCCGFCWVWCVFCYELMWHLLYCSSVCDTNVGVVLNLMCHWVTEFGVVASVECDVSSVDVALTILQQCLWCESGNNELLFSFIHHWQLFHYLFHSSGGLTSLPLHSLMTLSLFHSMNCCFVSFISGNFFIFYLLLLVGLLAVSFSNDCS